MTEIPKALDELADGAPDELQRDVAAAVRAERASWDDPAQDGAHASFRREAPTSEAVERVWREFWLPTLRGEDGTVSLEKLKGELFDCHHLIMAAPRVYHHVTGGITDDATASAEGVIALAERQVEHRIHRAREAQPDTEKAGVLHRIRERKRETAITAARALLGDIDRRYEASSGMEDAGEPDARLIEDLRDALTALEES